MLQKFLRSQLQRKISESLDSGKPLAFALKLAIRCDKETRTFYESLLRLEKRFANDKKPFLKELHSPQSELLRSWSDPVQWNLEEFSSSKKHSLGVALCVSSAVMLCVGLAIGFLPQESSNRFIAESTINKSNGSHRFPVQQSDPFEMMFEPLKISFAAPTQTLQNALEKSRPQFPHTIQEFSDQSQEILKQIPLVDTVTTDVFDLVKHVISDEEPYSETQK